MPATVLRMFSASMTAKTAKTIIRTTAMNGATLGSIRNPISKRRTAWITGSVRRPTVRTDQLKGFLSRYLKSERKRISRIAAEATVIMPQVTKEAIDWINDITVWLAVTSAALTLFPAHQKLP